MTGGTKRSSWLTFRRRLLLVRLLLRAPMGSADLIAAVHRELGEEGYPAAATSALKHDLDALKREYGCVVRYDRSTAQYALAELGDLALLDLPDSCMEALAFLETSFTPGSGLREHTSVRELLDRLVMLLPVVRQEQHQRVRAGLRVQLGNIAARELDAGVLTTIKRAVRQHQELLFSYLGLRDDEPRQHRVAPYAVFFQPEGHGYLDATLLEVTPPGPEQRYSAIDYRIDRMIASSLRILPQQLPAERARPLVYSVCYTLVPAVARRHDVAAHFPATEITYHDDGSATVSAQVTNLWQTRQTLLRYGTACQVLAPPELVALFRATAAGLAQLYPATPEPTAPTGL